MQDVAERQATGTQTTQAKLTEFLRDNPDVNLFEVLMTDLNGQHRGKWIERHKIEKICNGGIKLPISSLCVDVWGRDPADVVFADGDADGICVPVMHTLKRLPWASTPTAQLFVSLAPDSSGQVDQAAQSGEVCPFDPREQLKIQQERLLDFGLRPVVAFELEFYLFQQDRALGNAPRLVQQTSDLVTGGQTYGIDALQEIEPFLLELRTACHQLGLPFSAIISEAAPSQFELNLDHQADALVAADHAMMLKRTVQGVARRHGMRASFMAKPFGDLPGNGMHMHCSLVDEQGRNAFDGGNREGSPLLAHAIGGCLEALPDAFLLLAPHLNSYRRFQSESHAPLFANWGYENRTVALRVPAGDSVATRIEHRVAGADANPYLAAAAFLAGIHRGLTAKAIVPQALCGNGYEGGGAPLPRGWDEAVQRFAHSDFISQYFGSAFRSRFETIKKQEMDTFGKTVSPLEYDSYL